MTIDEQLNIFETQLENFVPETPTEQKLLKEASASLSAFRVYAEKEGLLGKEITSDEEREMWLRRSVIDPMRMLWEASVDHGIWLSNDRRRLESENEGSLKIGKGLSYIKDNRLYPPSP